MAAVEVHQIRRSYRVGSGILRRDHKKIRAVRGVTFHVERGELFGLLGPNGAGKTTLIKMLITLLLPSSGTARVLDLDVVTRAREVRRHIGYVFGGERGLYERLSALDNLRYFAELYGVPYREQRARIARLLDLVELTGRERERVEGYSRGMRQRLHIARGLLHDPEVLFLDEPSIGIDPVGARKLRRVIADLRASGKTIMLTTHYMYEADELCDRIAVIRQGQIVAEGSPDRLKARATGGRLLEVQAYGVAPHVVDRIGVMPGVRSVSVEARDQLHVLLIRAQPGVEVVAAVLACLDGIAVNQVTLREPTLEDAYVELIGA